MEARLRQRLVGAIVLASLAVVLVPILFDVSTDVSDEPSAVSITEIPERPADRLGSPASGGMDAPQTPRLEAALERERRESTASPEAGDGGATSGAEGASSGQSATAPAASATSSASSSTGSGTAPAAPTSDAAPPSEPAPAGAGWIVQLGSFVKPENALALHERLQSRGYPAFVEPGSSQRGAVSRVLVGPMPDRAQADASAAKLQREMALKGIVMPYPGG